MQSFLELFNNICATIGMYHASRSHVFLNMQQWENRMAPGRTGLYSNTRICLAIVSAIYRLAAGKP
jgi:hypothetical protein